MTDFLIIGVSVLTIFVLLSLAVYIYCTEIRRGYGGYRKSRGYREVKAHITKGFFHAAGEILNEAVRHKFSGGSNHRR